MDDRPPLNAVREYNTEETLQKVAVILGSYGFSGHAVIDIIDSFEKAGIVFREVE